MKWIKKFNIFESSEFNFISKKEISFYTKYLIKVKVDLSEYEFTIEKSKDFKSVSFEYEPDEFILSLDYNDGIINNIEFKEWLLNLSEINTNKTIKINEKLINLISIDNEVDIKEFIVTISTNNKNINFLVKLSSNLEIDNDIKFLTKQDKENANNIKLDLNDELSEFIIKSVI
jgi:hypothetical protein